METELKAFLDTCPEGEFSPAPLYFADGDFVSHLAIDVPYYTERVDSLLTVYRDMESGDVVGWKLKGVSKLLGTVQAFVATTAETRDELEIGLLFMAAGWEGAGEKKSDYEKLNRTFGAARISKKDLMGV